MDSSFSLDLEVHLNDYGEEELQEIMATLNEKLTKRLQKSLKGESSLMEAIWPQYRKEVLKIHRYRFTLHAKYVYENEGEVHYRLKLKGGGEGYSVKGDGRVSYSINLSPHWTARYEQHQLSQLWDRKRYGWFKKKYDEVFRPRHYHWVREPEPELAPVKTPVSLDDLLGLDLVKRRLLALRARFALCEAESRELPLLHACLTGPPGTGKTTIAQLLANIYYDHGQLSSGHVVVYNAGELMAKYVGQTIPKTQEILRSARGGVLVLDEAYVLANEGAQFAEEALSVLLPALEERDIAIVFAGYDLEMQDFLALNPGIQDRVGLHLQTEQLKPAQLTELLLQWLEKDKYKYDFGPLELIPIVEEWHKSESKRDHYASARSLMRLYDRWQEEYALDWQEGKKTLTISQLKSALNS